MLTTVRPLRAILVLLAILAVVAAIYGDAALHLAGTNWDNVVPGTLGAGG
jgi:hypothetical protein